MNRRNRIIILPCNGASAPGEITWIAAQELVIEGKARWFSREIPFDRDGEGTSKTPVILVSGCQKSCKFNEHIEKENPEYHRLMLADIGIEPDFIEDITREDIELTKDAVIAECTPVSKAVPLLFACCCK
jgi:uncharacterized metal-binding protein